MVIRIVVLLVVPALALGSQVETEQFDRASALKTYFDSAHALEGFSGVGLVARGDQVLFQRAFGLADRELGIPLSTDHIFRVGSLTKPVTAAAILHAVESGLMTLDDPICEYLSNCPPAWAGATIHHLLSHSSGIPEFFNDLESVPVEKTSVEMDRLLASFDTDPALEFGPGTDYRYRNFNYILLGYALEKASSKHWEEYLIAKVFEPLDLETIRYDRVYEVVPGRARGYTLVEGAVANIEYDDHAAFAAGGLRSTIGDFYGFLQSYFEGRVVSADWVDLAKTPVHQGYGYGLSKRELFGRDAFTHTGGIEGFKTVMAHFPEDNLYILVFANNDQIDASLNACDVAAIVLDWPIRHTPGSTDPISRMVRCGVEAP